MAEQGESFNKGDRPQRSRGNRGEYRGRGDRARGDTRGRGRGAPRYDQEERKEGDELHQIRPRGGRRGRGGEQEEAPL